MLIPIYDRKSKTEYVFSYMVKKVRIMLLWYSSYKAVGDKVILYVSSYTLNKSSNVGISEYLCYIMD